MSDICVMREAVVCLHQSDLEWSDFAYWFLQLSKALESQDICMRPTFSWREGALCLRESTVFESVWKEHCGIDSQTVDGCNKLSMDKDGGILEFTGWTNS